MKIGYVRVSTLEQNTARQDVLMQNLGVEKVFVDKCSGKDTARPQLQAMMAFARDGDVIIVESFSRLARNTKDLLELTDAMKSKGIDFLSQKENIDTNTPSGKLMLTVLGAISEFERDCIRQRQQEGIDLKKARGEYRGRTPIDVDSKEFESAYEDWKTEKANAKQTMERLGLKPNTFYRRVAVYEASKEAKSNVEA